MPKKKSLILKNNLLLLRKKWQVLKVKLRRTFQLMRMSSMLRKKRKAEMSILMDGKMMYPGALMMRKALMTREILTIMKVLTTKKKKKKKVMIRILLVPMKIMKKEPRKVKTKKKFPLRRKQNLNGMKDITIMKMVLRT